MRRKMLIKKIKYQSSLGISPTVSSLSTMVYFFIFINLFILFLKKNKIINKKN
jgi:hypothetical protein